jgi:Flp pilus assembly protein TadD
MSTIHAQPVPEYTLEERRGGGAWLLRVSLPGVSSMAQLELAATSDTVQLSVSAESGAAAFQPLSVTLPATVDPNAVVAKFSKKRQVLRMELRALQPLDTGGEALDGAAAPAPQPASQHDAGGRGDVAEVAATPAQQQRLGRQPIQQGNQRGQPEPELEPRSQDVTPAVAEVPLSVACSAAQGMEGAVGGGPSIAATRHTTGVAAVTAAVTDRALETGCTGAEDSSTAHDNHAVLEEMRAAAAELKRRGNLEFGRGDYRHAVELFSRAAQLEPTNAVHLANRCLALLKLGRNDEALRDAVSVLEFRPGWGKAHYRHGMALLAVQRLEEAVQSFERASSLDPDNVQVTAGLKKAQDELRLAQKAAQERMVAKQRRAEAAARDAARCSGQAASTARAEECVELHGDAAIPYDGWPCGVSVTEDRGRGVVARSTPPSHRALSAALALP